MSLRRVAPWLIGVTAIVGYTVATIGLPSHAPSLPIAQAYERTSPGERDSDQASPAVAVPASVTCGRLDGNEIVYVPSCDDHQATWRGMVVVPKGADCPTATGAAEDEVATLCMAPMSVVTEAPTSMPACTPGYEPCLPPTSDYDCAGGSGNGPLYVPGLVLVSGADPYDLDANDDGFGCEA